MEEWEDEEDRVEGGWGGGYGIDNYEDGKDSGRVGGS